MARPHRSIDAETVRGLARYAGLPLDPERVDGQLQHINVFLGFLEEWESVRLGYWFEEDGTFGHAGMVSQYRVPWAYPTRLTKDRAVDADTGVLESVKTATAESGKKRGA